MQIATPESHFQRALNELRLLKRDILAARPTDADSSAVAQGMLLQICGYLVTLRDEIEADLREETLDDVTPEQAREAIAAINIFEAELRGGSSIRQVNPRGQDNPNIASIRSSRFFYNYQIANPLVLSDQLRVHTIPLALGLACWSVDFLAQRHTLTLPGYSLSKP